MRKITSLLTLLLLCVAGVQAQIASLADISATGVYTIKCNRGTWIADQTNSKVLSSIVGGESYDATSEAQQWTFEDIDTEAGTAKIKSVLTGTYASYDSSVSNTLSLASEGTDLVITKNGTGFTIDEPAGNRLNFATSTTWFPNGYSVDDWKALDDGNQFTITKVADAAAQEVSVTYNLVLADDPETVIATVTATQFTGDTPTVPEAFQNDYLSYTCDVDKITAETTTVTITATVSDDLPFTPSTGDDLVWNTLQIKGQYYVTYAADATPNVTLSTTLTPGDATQQWAFVGDPLTGYVIINKAAGKDLILASANPEEDSSEGGSTHAVLAAADDETTPNKEWFPAASTNITGGFYLNNDDNYALNQRATESLDYWTGGKDLGSTFVAEVAKTLLDSYQGQFEEDFDDFAEGATFETGNGYFQLSAENYATLQALYQSLLTQEAWAENAEDATKLAEIYEDACNQMETKSTELINWPKSGYYRIKSNSAYSYDSYMGVGDNLYNRGVAEYGYGLKTIPAAEATTDLSTLIQLKKTDVTGVYKINVQGRGVVGPTANNEPFVLSAELNEGDDFLFIPQADNGRVAIQDATAGGDTDFLHESNWGQDNAAIVHWTEDAGASQWFIEDAETADFELAQAGDGKYYGIVYAPVGFLFETDDATVYHVAYATVKDEDGEKSTDKEHIALTTMEDEIWDNSSANLLPALIVSETNATVTGKLNGTASDLESAMTGTCFEIAEPEGALFLNYDETEGKVGFLLADADEETEEGTEEGTDADESGDETLPDVNVLAPNTAYIIPATGVEALYLDGTSVTTAIKAAIAKLSETDAPIYDLTGRKVQKATKGVYVIAGKKVVK